MMKHFGFPSVRGADIRADRSGNDRRALVPSIVSMKSWSDCVPVPAGSSSAHASSVVEFTRTRHDRSSSALTVGRSRPSGGVARSMPLYQTLRLYIIPFTAAPAQRGVQCAENAYARRLGPRLVTPKGEQQRQRGTEASQSTPPSASSASRPRLALEALHPAAERHGRRLGGMQRTQRGEHPSGRLFRQRCGRQGRT
eukprot:scaffold19803_cov64-Phaeocystis_antarctica.AAC.3